MRSRFRRRLRWLLALVAPLLPAARGLPAQPGPAQPGPAQPGPAQPSPAGLWNLIDDTSGTPRAEIRIDVTSGRLTGIIVRSLVPGQEGGKLCDRCTGARRNQPLIGMAILTGLVRDAANPLLWTGGEILDPDTGKIYKARVELAGDGRSLRMRGFLGIAMIGRTQVWTRAGT